VLGLGNDSDGSGDGNGSDDESHCVPQLVTALLGKRVRAIAAGSYMSCAVTDAGALYTWGEDLDGSLGHGDELDSDVPTLVQGLTGICVVGVSTDITHTLALAADGCVHAFGGGAGLGIRRVGKGGGEEAVGPMRTPQRIPNLICKVPQ
jgi:alpha-tubulin suppressor-like RCC1 family protein